MTGRCRIPASSRQNPANSAIFQQSDTKIREPSAVNSGYQQTPMPGDDEFLQICVQK
jgi:endo-beta-N-acetylglucosaminidase D